MERLQKYLARCGVASRRRSEVLITEGQIKVNGEVVRELGVKVDGEKDVVTYNDKVVTIEEVKRYIILNKPLNVLSAAKDDRGRKTVVDLIDVKERIYPIGRLDYDTTGLLLLTNDGEVFNRIMHPSKKIGKVYEARIQGTPTKEEIERFCNGVVIDGYKTAKASFDIIKKYPDNTLVRIEIHEGKNRQVRKMCSEIGHRVLRLKRVSIGEIKLQEMKVGQWRELTQKEVNYLKGR